MSQTLELQLTCPSCQTEFETTAHTLVDKADEADAEVYDAAEAPLQDLRACAGRVPQIRHLPDLFSQVSRPGVDPWRAQSQLVTEPSW